MKYVIIFVFASALLPMKGANINLGLFYLTPFKMSLIFLFVACTVRELSKRARSRITLEKENRWSLIFMLFWFAYSLLTILWCRDMRLWVHGEYFIAAGVLFMILLESIHFPWPDFKFVLKGIVWVIALHNLIGWYEMLTHSYFFAPAERVNTMRIYERFYPISMFSNQNDLMLVLILGLFLAAFFTITEKEKWKKVLYAGMAASNCLLTVLTDSRLGIGGMLLGIVWMIWIVLAKKGRLYFAGLSGGTILLSVFLAPGWYMEIGKFLALWIPILMNRFIESSDVVRLNLVRNGLTFLVRTIGMGVGTGNTEYWMAADPVYYVRGFVNMHNWWVELLTNFGVIVFALYILFFVQLFYGMYKKFKYSSVMEVRMAGLIFQGFMIAFVLAGMSSSSNWVKEWLWLIWAFLIVFQGYAL